LREEERLRARRREEEQERARRRGEEQERSRWRGEEHERSNRSDRKRMRPTLSPREGQWLLDTMGFTAKRFENLSKEDVPDLKRAGKRAMLRLHPDKVQGRGATEAEYERATEAFQRFRGAYEEVLAMFDPHLDALLDVMHAMKHRVATLERAFAGGGGVP
jgi:DnaJ-domain-containing protein 1